MLLFQGSSWFYSNGSEIQCSDFTEPATAILLKKTQTSEGWQLSLSDIQGWCGKDRLQIAQGNIHITDQNQSRNIEYLPVGVEVKLKRVKITQVSRYFLHLEATGKTRIYNESSWQRKLYKPSSLVKIAAKADYYLEQPVSGFFKALLLADRQGLDKNLKEKIVNQGIFHLFAISGLHVGLLYLWFKFLFRLIVLIPLRSVQQGAGWLVIDLLSLISLFLFLKWIGMPLTALRAWLMLSAWVLSQYFFRFLPTWKIVLMVGGWMLLADPSLAGQLSFQLSFLSVMSILLLYPLLPETNLKQKKHQRMMIYLQNLLLISLWIQFITLPLILMVFQKVNLLGFLVNPVHILFVGFVFLPSSLLVLAENIFVFATGAFWWSPEWLLYSWLHFAGKVWMWLIESGDGLVNPGLFTAKAELPWYWSAGYWGVIMIAYYLVRKKQGIKPAGDRLK